MSIDPNGDMPVHPGHKAGPRPLRSTAAVRGLGASAREEVQERLSVVTEAWCEHVINGVRNHKRGAMILWAQAMRIIGADVEVNVNLATMHAFQLPADEVARIIEAHRESSATSIEACQDDGVALLRWVIGQEPERRGTILAALGDDNARMALEAPADGESNGNANGHSSGAA